VARPTVRRIAPPRTLAIESPDDLQAFRRVLTRRWRLPHVRIALRLMGLHQVRCDAHERHINRLLASHPFAAAGFCALVMAVLAGVYPLAPAGAQTLPALGAWVIEGLLAGVLGAFAGVGLHRLVTRWRLSRLCTEIEAELSA
jgi:hypothetical protein